MESQEVSTWGSFSRQNASVARSQCGRMAASKSNSCGVISAKPSSHKFWIRGPGSGVRGFSRSTVGRKIEQAVRVLQFMFGQPVRISLEQQREVVEFILQLAVAGQAGGEGAEFGRGEMVLLQFAQQPAQLLGETRPTGAAVEQFQFVLVLHQQGAQNHHAAFLGEQAWRSDLQFFEYELCEPLE